jgi:ABC-type glycerol-3-phosphate transport system substrate-binding protein
MIKLKRFTIVVLTIIALSLAGCSGEETSGLEDGKANLTMWVYGWETEAAKLIEEEAKKWGETHPNVRIEIIPQTGDAISQKLPATIAGGNNPDISFIDAGVLSTNLADKGMLLALDDFGVNELKDQFYEPIWNSFLWEEKTYGLRITSNNLGLFYNKELFDKAGLSYPDESWTWDDLRNAANKLTDAENNVYGIELPVYNDQGVGTWVWMPFLWQAGGEYLNEERTEAVYNSPEGVRALEFWNTLVNEDKVAPTTAPGQGVDRFITGKAGMTINGPWMIKPWFEDPSMTGKIGVAPLPQDKTRATNIGGEGMVIFKDTKHPEEAVEFVKHLATDSEFLEKFYKSWVTVPALKEYAEFYTDDPLFGEPMEVFSKQMDVGRMRQFIPAWNQIGDILDRELAETFYNNKDPEEALNDAAAETNKLLQETE